MANPYFDKLSNFLYVDRTKGSDSSISEYSVVKNFFKRVKLRDDILQDLTFFNKYIISGDDRPDNVAEEVYDDPFLDWVVLTSNNIINIQDEWPLSQSDFYSYVIEKYNDETTLYSGIHHYESIEIKNSNDVIIIPAGKTVGAGQSVSFFDDLSEQQVTRNDVATPITNYMFEENLNNKETKKYWA